MWQTLHTRRHETERQVSTSAPSLFEALTRPAHFTVGRTDIFVFLYSPALGSTQSPNTLGFCCPPKLVCENWACEITSQRENGVRERERCCSSSSGDHALICIGAAVKCVFCQRSLAFTLWHPFKCKACSAFVWLERGGPGGRATQAPPLFRKISSSFSKWPAPASAGAVRVAPVVPPPCPKLFVGTTATRHLVLSLSSPTPSAPSF